MTAAGLLRGLPEGAARRGPRLAPPPAVDLVYALRRLRELTRGTYDAWDLAGPAHRRNRVELLELLTGRRVPATAAGVTNLRAALFAALPVEGDCLATRLDNLADAAENLLATRGTPRGLR